MQFGWAALDEIIQVSDQPVAPSLGVTLATFLTLPALIVFCWYSQAVPMAMSPLWNPSTSSVEVTQYLLMSVFWTLRRATAAASWSLSRAYGLVIFRSGCVFMRNSAASAM